MTSTPFFLFIGTSDEPAVTTKLKATETDYRRKMLESRPENWQRIIEILRDPDLAGVLVKLTAKTCELLTNSDYADLTPELVQAIATVPNIVFIHEAVLSDVVAPPDPNSENVGIDESGFDAPPVDNPLQIGIDYLHDPEEVDHSKSFKPIPEDTRDEVRRLVVKHDLNLAPYKRNAHLAMLAAQFIDNADRKLLFRIYVPAGRLWAKEADRLLGLFSDWLAKTKGQVIRQGGYKTGQGAVYEFYSDEPSLGQNLSSELYQFSDFLDLCIQDPDAAVALLAPGSPNLAEIGGIVSRYAAEARRLRLDLNFDRDQKLLQIRYRLQSELIEDSTSLTQALRLAEGMLPRSTELPAILHPASSSGHTGAPQPSIVVNNQVIGVVHGVVAQELSGTANLGPAPAELLELIGRFGGHRQAELESAVHELEDAGSKPGERLAADQKIRGFLIKVGDKVSAPALAVLQKYVESRLGL